MSGRAQDLGEQSHDLWAGQAIVDEEAVLVTLDHPGLAQHPQLLGDVRLRTAQGSLQVTNAGLAPAQFIQNMQPAGMRKELEQFGHTLIRILLHPCYGFR